MAQTASHLKAKADVFVDYLYTPVSSASFCPLDSSYKANDLTLFPEMQVQAQPASLIKVQAPRFTARLVSPRLGDNADSDSPLSSAVTSSAASALASSSASSSGSASSDPKYREMKMKYLRALKVPVPLSRGSGFGSDSRRSLPPPSVSSLAKSSLFQPITSASPSPSEGDVEQPSEARPLSPALGTSAGLAPPSREAEPAEALPVLESGSPAVRPPSREATPSPLPSSPRTPSLLAQQLKALRGTSPVTSDGSGSDSDSSPSYASRSLTREDEAADWRSSPIAIPRGTRPRRGTAPGPLGDRRRRNGRVALDSVAELPAALAGSVSSSSSSLSQAFSANAGAGSVGFSFSEVFASRPAQSFAVPAHTRPVYEFEESEASEVAFSVDC